MTPHPSGGHPLRVLIVDDEPLAREHIRHLLSEQPDVSVVGQAETGEEALEAIRRLDPDIVFLDMQMPKLTGLQLVREIGPSSMPPTVFVTAHDEFALQAFELAAADYLVKPFSDERFEEAFRRARERVELNDLDALREQLRLVLETGAAAKGGRQGAKGGAYLQRIAVQERGRMWPVSVSEIDYIVASGVYAELHMGDETHLVRTSLNTLEEQLDPEQFFRLHRSVIARLDQVDVLVREGGGSYHVQLKSGKKLPVSRSRREELEQRLGKL